MPYSGCHCTPRQKRRVGSSIASITPSAARGADDDAGADPLGRLVVGAVDRQPVGAGDAVQQRARRDRDLVAGLGARVRLLVRQRVRHGVGDVLDQRAAQHDVEQLLAAADAEHRLVALDRALGDRPLEAGAALLEP